MEQPTDIRSEWYRAVLEGRMATADYLAPDLPPVNLDDMVCPPGDLAGRKRYAVAGEIGR